MGASRRIRSIRLPRARYALGAVALTGAAVVALSGCAPVGGLDTTTVAVTTQRQASRALDREGVHVAWLSCRGKAENGGKDPGTGSALPVTVVGVDCEGRTDTGKKIVVFGRVTGITGQACVRGLLTANVDGRTVFQVSVLGDCDRTGDTGGRPPTAPGPGQEKPPPAPRPPGAPGPSASCTDRPPAPGK
ncbi:hypothetical protein [Streptomyces sp. UNOB3_S3]|uniref:hypothetical protein n=1 Tax=Streptomyces sp. UNOB3_S3 TaxID=2871682 RepID=UPI001E4E698F|nr:hypothetical protein [Streptomyces sp. UNOB3_S3]MCC3778798.1 hypothetical protein [Streptomyces sp. UNOB3_S3]